MACQVHDLDGIACRTERRCLNWAARDSARPEAVGATGHLPWSDGQQADPRRCHQRCDNALRRRRRGWLRERPDPDWRRSRICRGRHPRKRGEPGSSGSPGPGRTQRRVGLADTMAAARRAHFPVLGLGVNAAAAWSPYVVTVKGVRIAFLGVSQVAELASSWVATKNRSGQANAINLHRTLAAVRAAKKVADVVIVIMHWGTEGQTCPDANQLALAPKLAAAGANIIVGSHAHILQGSGWLGRTFVAYGMANFLWWETSYSTATGVLLLTLHRRGPLTWRFVPATVSGTGQPILDTGRAAKLARAPYRRLRTCAQLSAHPGH